MTQESPISSTVRPDRHVISEEEFQSLLAGQAHDFVQLANGLLESVPEQWTQRQLYYLYRSSTDLETFLDDHGAQRNQRFRGVREHSAVVRWLAVAMGSLVHLNTRLPSYEHADKAWSERVLAPTAARTALAIGELIGRSLEALRTIWLNTGSQWPDGVMRLDSLGAGTRRLTLPADLGSPEDYESDHDGSDTVRLVARYLDLVSRLRSTHPRALGSIEDMREVMEKFCSESRARSFEARIHNLQSTYDSRIHATQDEQSHPELMALRGAISQALHLFEAITAMAHLYERHWGRDAEAHALRSIVTEEDLLGITLNDCAIMAYESMDRASQIADELLQTFSTPEILTASIPEGVTLHARPISLIVAVVNHHGVPVKVEIDDDSCSAASIMQFLVLSGSHPDAKELRFSGEKKALADIEALFQADLGENGLDSLPAQLQYLRP